MTRPTTTLLRSLCALMVGIAFISGCAKKPNHAAIPRSSTVVALGDSLTFGTGATSEGSYPSVLATLSGWNVINAGVPGETAAEGCARLSALIDEHKPALVLVLLGGNDLLRRRPESEIRDALIVCHASARAGGIQMVLMPVPRFGAGGLGDAGVYDEVRSEIGVPMIDAGLADLLGRASMRSDHVHLNASGYRAMAGIVADGLREHGFLAR